MATTHELYDSGFLNLLDGTVQWDEDTITAVILSSDYSKDLSSHSTYGDVSGDEIDDDDYSPVEVTNKDISLSDGNVTYTSDDIDFGSDVSISGQYIVFLQGDPASLSDSDPLISVHDLGEEKSSTNSDFRLNAPSAWFEVSRN